MSEAVFWSLAIAFVIIAFSSAIGVVIALREGK